MKVIKRVAPEATITLELGQTELDFIYRLLFNHVEGVGFEREISDRIVDALEEYNEDEAPLFCDSRRDMLSLVCN